METSPIDFHNSLEKKLTSSELNTIIIINKRSNFRLDLKNGTRNTTVPDPFKYILVRWNLWFPRKMYNRPFSYRLEGRPSKHDTILNVYVPRDNYRGGRNGQTKSTTENAALSSLLKKIIIIRLAEKRNEILFSIRAWSVFPVVDQFFFSLFFFSR